MKTFIPLPLIFLLTNLAIADTNLTTAPVWAKQTSGVKARLRGVSAANDDVAWASGSGNTVLHTQDGGAHWEQLALPAQMQATPLDFRDVDAVDAHTAYLLSIGEASASRIYKTTDAGAHWTLQYTNPDAKGFLDAMTFWDANNGLVIGDSIDGHLQILITGNGGATWSKVPDAVLPPALPNEGAFSSSGSNIAMVGHDDAWIGLGGPTRSRVLHTGDRGKTWTVVDTPIAASESAGIFSVAFRDAQHGVIVGGDYKKENAAIDNVAITSDGGKTWALVRDKGLSGMRSAVAYIPGTASSLIAVGPTGADISQDDGKIWTPLAYPASIAGFDAISFAPGRKTAWASGNRGELGRLKFE
jgi:photosystem II stability/assembly factor-like uncharacterized protein